MPKSAEAPPHLSQIAFPSDKLRMRGAAMKSHRFVRFAAVAAVCLLFSSCGESEKPLSDPLKAKPDAQLVGIWRTKHGEGSVEYVHVARAGGKLPPGIMRTVSVQHNQDGTLGQPGEDLLFCTCAGENHYLNVVLTVDDERDVARLSKAGWNTKLIKSYCLVKYAVKGDSLTVWIMDPASQRELIKSGKIKGVVNKDSGRFTDTSENLAALLSAPESAKLFQNKDLMHRYERVK
jgi:hypothetical protein